MVTLGVPLFANIALATLTQLFLQLTDLPSSPFPSALWVGQDAYTGGDSPFFGTIGSFFLLKERSFPKKRHLQPYLRITTVVRSFIALGRRGQEDNHVGSEFRV